MPKIVPEKLPTDPIGYAVCYLRQPHREIAVYPIGPKCDWRMGPCDGAVCLWNGSDSPEAYVQSLHRKEADAKREAARMQARMVRK